MAKDGNGRKAAPRSKRKPDAKASPPLAIVGIGASLKSLPSLHRLFTHLGDNGGLSFVVGLQASEAVDHRALLEQIAVDSRLTVLAAKDGDRLERGHVYLAPANTKVTFNDGALRIEDAAEPPGERGTIDSLLVSLATVQKAHAIGVVLAGLGGDGVLGAVELKQAGGLAVVEIDGEIEDGGLPEPAAGLADFILPAEAIPARIEAHAKHLAEREAESADAAPSEDAAYLPKIAAILRNRTGHDFHGYKPNTFLRRIQRRMNVVQVDHITAYLTMLRSDALEVDNLFQDLLIGVTQFFRDPHEFAVLADKVVPAIFKDKGAGDHVRLWVLGCATGEEAYSLAILVREHMAGLEFVPHVQIFATDIDARALAQARIGRYPESIAKDIAPERLARWFVKEGSTYCVHKDLREMCLFSAHNIIKDAPFSRIDLISCRNLLIYLNAELQSRVIPLFHFALKPGGFLFLGPSENVTRHPKLFSPLDRSHRIFKRLDTVTRALPEFPLTARTDVRVPMASGVARARPFTSNLGKRAERIAERHAPAYVVIDGDHEVLHFSGRTGRYLEPTTGAANLNLMNLVHRDLRLDLRAALHKAEQTQLPVKVEKLRIGGEEGGRWVSLVVEPLREAENEPANFVVLFQDGGSAHADDGAGGESGFLRDEHVQRLENELRLSKERLQATIEELESTNEELKSSNEEYQSINEEMQSANEELETSKEELQSVNEELQTVNGELAHRVHELAKANSDIKNLLESTQIATLFLDNDLRVRSFTPIAAELFYLLDTDIGRPIGHIANELVYPELQDDVRRVLRTLSIVEREAKGTRSGTTYFVRVLPYRSVDNFIAGAVITFLDISATVQAEHALRVSESRFRLILESSTDYAIIATDPDGKITLWNTGAANITGWDKEDVLGRNIEVIFNAEDRAEGAPAEEMRRASAEGRAADERWHVRKDGTQFWGSGMTTPIKDGPLSGYLKIMHDRTEQRMSGERQRLLLAELQHRVRNILAVVRSLAARTADTAGSIDEFQRHFEGRLSTLARTQNVLTRTSDVTMEIGDLVRDELLAVGAREGETLELEGPELWLRQPAAEPIALAIHELATNALKYGALSQPQGRIQVRWRVFNTKSGKRLSIDWQESGVPAISLSPPRRGFGRELIERGLPYELGAATSLHFQPGGARAAIEIPLQDKFAMLEPKRRGGNKDA